MIWMHHRGGGGLFPIEHTVRAKGRENSSMIHSIKGVAPEPNVNSRRRYNRWGFAEDGWRYISNVAEGWGLWSERCLIAVVMGRWTEETDRG